MVLGIGEGKIELTLDKTAYSPEETIKGKLNISLNQPTSARQLVVEFFGEVRVRSGKNSHIERVNETKKTISGDKNYANGETYDFELVVPSDVLPKKQGGVIVSLMNFFNPIPTFYVNAYLDMPMKFDMSKKVAIQIVPIKPNMGI